MRAPRSPAVDIQLHDVAWEGARLSLLDGSPDAKVAALAPGANVTHTYTLRAHAPGATLGKPASAKYRDAALKTQQARTAAVASRAPAGSSRATPRARCRWRTRRRRTAR